MSGACVIPALAAAILAGRPGQTSSMPASRPAEPPALAPLVLALDASAVSADAALTAAAVLGATVALTLPPPDPPVPAGGDERSFTLARLALEPLIARQVPLLVGWAGSALDHEHLSPEPVRFEDGSTASGPINLHDPELARAFFGQIAAAVDMAERSGADIRGYWLGLGPHDGTVEHPSGGPLRPLFAGYDRHGAAAFREFCRAWWNDDPAALGRDRGQAPASWQDLSPPAPRREASVPLIDERPQWWAFCRWREAALTGFVRELASQARRGTERPLGLRLGTAFADSAAGPFVGGLLSGLRDCGLSFAIIDGAHTLADVRYLGSACRYYDIHTLIAAARPWRSGLLELRKTAMNALLGGCDVLACPQAAGLDAAASPVRDDEAAGAPTPAGSGCPPGADTIALLRDVGGVLGAWELQRPPGRIAFLHSAVTAMLRAPAYGNHDVRNVYDDLLSEHLHLAAWAAALGYPDVIDERMILEGRLEGLRLLIVPNTSYTIVPAEVLRRLAAWIDGGGWLAACGAGCFLDRLDEHGTVLRGDAGVAAEWLGGLAAGTVAGESGVATGTATSYGLDPRGIEWLGVEAGDPQASACVTDTAFETSQENSAAWTPILSDGRGRWALAAIRRGAGGVLICTEPVPLVDPWTGRLVGGRAENASFFTQGYPRLLQALARRIGADGFPVGENIRVVECGRDLRRGREVFAGLIAEPSGVSASIVMPPGATGEAELVVFGRQISRMAWSDGTPVSFRQPPERELYRDPTGTLSAGRMPVAWPYARAEFALPPPGTAQGRPAKLIIEWR